MTLSEILLSGENKTSLVQDCTKLVEEEVSSKKGLSGTAIRAVFSLITAIRENLLNDVLGRLMPSFAMALEPFYEAFLQGNQPSFENYIAEKSAKVTEALLNVTDQRAANAHNQVLKSGYKKLRGAAEKQVQASIPQLAQLIQGYLPQTE